MQLRVLGSGTCFAQRAGQSLRLPPLFVVELGAGRRVLFECSEGARWRLTQAGIDPLSVGVVAVSHSHADHAALPQFIQSRTCAVIDGAPRETAAIELLMPVESATRVSDLWRWHSPEDNGAAAKRYKVTVTGVWSGWSREVFRDVVLRAFSVKHKQSAAVAWRITAGEKVIAYSGDSAPCEGLVECARHADLFICDAAARVGEDLSEKAGHCNPKQAGEAAREARAKVLVLTHYTGDDTEEAMVADARASGYDGEVIVAVDGMTLSA